MMIRQTNIKPFPNSKYYAVPANDNWLISLHGSGQYGLPDGSQLSKVEDSCPWVAAITGGFEMVCNLMFPQASQAGAVSNWDLVLKSWATIFKNDGKAKDLLYSYFALTQDSFGGIGWSQGAEVLLNQLSDPGCKFTYMVFICLPMIPGGADAAKYAGMKDIPIRVIVGSNDTKATWATANRFVTGYNSVPGRKNKAEIWIVEGASHGQAKDEAYNLTGPIGSKVYDFVKSNQVVTAPVFEDHLFLNGVDQGKFEIRKVQV